MWEEVEWLKHAFPARVNAAVHLLFQRKLTHREVTDEPMELLLMYPETTQFHGSLLQCPPPPIPVSFLDGREFVNSVNCICKTVLEEHGQLIINGK